MAGTPAGLGAAASAGVGASAAVGDGLSLSDATYATVTEMITSGIASRPLDDSSNVASNAAVIGSRSMVAVIAPMPMAALAIMSSPGRWESATPPTAPRNMGEDRSAAEAAQRQAVGEAFADDQPDERSHRVASGGVENRAQRRLAGEQHQRRALAAGLR